MVPDKKRKKWQHEKLATAKIVHSDVEIDNRDKNWISREMQEWEKIVTVVNIRVKQNIYYSSECT